VPSSWLRARARNTAIRPSIADWVRRSRADNRVIEKPFAVSSKSSCSSCSVHGRRKLIEGPPPDVMLDNVMNKVSFRRVLHTIAGERCF
jgi:hypothetical protein